jgi:hypothetical protein
MRGIFRFWLLIAGLLGSWVGGFGCRFGGLWVLDEEQMRLIVGIAHIVGGGWSQELGEHFLRENFWGLSIVESIELLLDHWLIHLD